MLFENEHQLGTKPKEIDVLIMRANWEMMEEVKKMCDALKELFADELEESEKRGIAIGEVIGEERGMGRMIGSFINVNLAEGNTVEQVGEKLVKYFALNTQQAEQYMKSFQ